MILSVSYTMFRYTGRPRAGRAGSHQKAAKNKSNGEIVLRKKDEKTTGLTSYA